MNFQFYGPEKSIKLAKKIKLKGNCKTSTKVKCKQIPYNVLCGLLMDVPAIERLVLRGNVYWDLQMMSTIVKSPL